MICARLVTGVFLCAAFAACTPTQQSREQFTRLVREFNDDLRWGRYEIAADNLPSEDSQLFLQRVALAGPELVMADQDVQAIRFGATDDVATSMVRFDWYSKRDMIVKTTTVEQKWERRNGKWLVTKQRRAGGDRFPLVTEPAAPARAVDASALNVP